ncbi:MAG: sulfotransferase domain-containing protein, partial [Pseudomonadota bacterium]|nr:sulfotransferase domain-containing protein [Pseudomonadota bacterium]
VPIRNNINAISYTNYNLPRGGYTHGFRQEKPLGEHSFAIQKNNRISGVVFMVRSPERVIISYYYQCLYRDKNYNKSISEFIRDKNYGIRKYIAYLEYYLPIIKESKGLIIRYEDMKTEGIHVLSKVLTYMQLKLDSDVITHIYENSSFENMKKIEVNNVFNLIWFKQLDINEKNSRKIRTGGKDNIEEIFSDKDRVYMENVCSISYALKELGYV